MALREVTVEVTAKYIIKVNANNAEEAMWNAEHVLFTDIITPDYIDSVILDVQPMNVSEEDESCQTQEWLSQSMTKSKSV